jgi:hypothetical protein
VISTDTDDDNLSQPQREAIVDLLLFAMYEDRRVVMQEDIFIDQHVRKMKWESGTYASTYVDMATARVRQARESAEGREHFLQRIRDRLSDPVAKQRAIDMCRELLDADKLESPEESQFLAGLPAVLGL